MEWITNNWILLLIAALCIGMFFFGRGCCSHRKDACDDHEPNSCETDSGGKDKKSDGGCCG